MTDLEIDIVMTVGKKKNRKRKRNEMEIKTCEEYVLNRLLELEQENFDLKNELDLATDFRLKYFEDIAFIKEALGIRVKKDSTGDRWICANGFYETKYDKQASENVDRMMEIFGLVLDEDEE